VLGTRRFADLVGTQKALELLGATRPFNVEAAVQMGFVQQVLTQDEWANATEESQALAVELDDATRAQLYRVLDTVQADSDLANLVRSAARPGLKDRLYKYLGK
jgi:enoyl-CoA hydratase/carnithine racemase